MSDFQGLNATSIVNMPVFIKETDSEEFHCLDKGREHQGRRQRWN